MLTRQWMKTARQGREVVFLIRPMEQPYQEGTRRFCAYHNGELVGFAFFDPVYRDGKIVSYVPNISRFSNKFKYGIFYPLMCHAIEVFRREGVECLHLGLCPSVVDDEDLPCDRGCSRPGRLLYSTATGYSIRAFISPRAGSTEWSTRPSCAHKEALP